MKINQYKHLFLGFAISVLVAGCGFSADSQKGSSGERDGLRTEGWAAGISNLDSGPEMAFTPQIAVEPDGGGTAIALWVKLADPDPFDSNPQQVYRLYAADYNGATWSAAAVIDSGSAGYYSAWAPKVSMDDAGNAIAVWQQTDGTAERIYARRFSGGAWTGAPEILDSGGGASSPSIAVEPDGGGTAMAVYTRLQTGIHRAYARHLTGGIGAGAWGTEANVDAFRCCSSFSTVHGGGAAITDDVGQWTSTVIDNNGVVHISYYANAGSDTSNATNLRYSYNLQTICVDGGAGCANATNATVGQYTSLVVNSTRRVFISYYDATNLDLRYATCGGDCLTLTNWTTVCVDGRANPTCVATGATAINTGQHNSLAEDSSGRLHLVYQNASTTGVRYTTCLPAAGNSFCTAVNSWTTPINLPGAVSASIDMSMAITASSTAGSPGVLHVSYEGSAGNLRYYSCDITSTGTNCAAAASWGAGFVNIPAVSPDGTWISLKAGPSSTGGALGRLHLVFRNNGTTLFSYTTCDLTTNTDCRTAANWNAFVAVDAAANANQRISLGIDGGGVLHVSYTDSTAQDLKYATCSPGGGTTCTVAANWTLVCLEGSTTGCSSPIRSNWNLDGYSSLAVDSFGEVAIAYHDNTAATTGNTGLRLRLAASLGGQTAGPVVAMDSGGNAIAGFIRPMLTGCPALPKRDTSVVAGSDNPDNNGLNSELSHAGCYASTPAVNKFTAATTSWLGTLDINPGSPTQAYSESTQTTADICFQEGDDSVGGGANDANLAGYNSACVNFSQLGISMERTTGNASVVMKLDWMEQENANGCSGSDAPADVGDAHGGGGGANNDDPASGQANQCPPSTVAWDEFNGDAITTMRYPATALWDGDNGAATAGAATTMTDGAKAWVVNQWTGSMVEIISGTGQGQRRSIVSNTATVLTITPNWTTNPAGGSTYKISAWGNTYLYAHSMQPTDAQLDNTTVVNVVSNCPVSGQYQESLGADGAGRILLNCKVNAPSIAMSGDASQTTLAVYERYDGTNYDIYADCFTLGGSTCGTTAIPGPTCADGNFNDGWRSVSCDTGATFRGNGFMPPPIVNTGTSEASSLATVTTPYLVLNNTAVSRTAFSPQAAMDSTGNGLAVWTERDGNQWRVYGMRFIAGFVGCTVGTDCGFITASRVPIDAFGADPSCASGTCMYSNPVLSMEWVNAGNAPSCPAGVNCGSAWTLMLDTELFGGALLPPILNVRVQAHQWTPP